MVIYIPIVFQDKNRTIYKLFHFVRSLLECLINLVCPHVFTTSSPATCRIFMAFPEPLSSSWPLKRFRRRDMKSSQRIQFTRTGRTGWIETGQIWRERGLWQRGHIFLDKLETSSKIKWKFNPDQISGSGAVRS